MRTWIETVKPWPALVTGQIYDVRIADIKKGPDRTHLLVNLEFLAGEQASRVITISLPLPIKPEGITAIFFRAAGCEVSPDAKIAPQSVIDRRIKCRLEVRGDSIILTECTPSGKEEHA